MVVQLSRFRVRKIRVAAGDVFQRGDRAQAVLVLRVDGQRAECVREGAGTAWRRSRIQVARLQREYARASEAETAAVHRAYEQHLRRLSSGGSGS